jgi:hypothetical protein
MPKAKEVIVQEDTDSQAATLAVKHLINPKKGKLQEVSYIPVGAVHSLTMLQTYEEYFVNLLIQVKNTHLWYLRRDLNKQIQQGLTTVDAANEELARSSKLEETVDQANLFIGKFRNAYYQHSRGKEGKFVEALTMLADTDMQTRNPDMEDGFKVRSQ